MMKIGVLAVQGAFAEHEKTLASLGADYFEIRQRSDLVAHPDGIILPGGESTVMGKLICDLKIKEPLSDCIKNGFPVLGTCAGMILLAAEIAGGEKAHLASMDITVVRNAYGRQLGSFEKTARFGDKSVRMVFIRAPYVSRAGAGVQILSEVDGKIVAVRQGNILATAFHPELSEDTTVHEYFMQMIKERSLKIVT